MTTPRDERTMSSRAERKSKNHSLVKSGSSDSAGGGKLTITVRPRPPPSPSAPAEPWKHPDELEYIRPDWSRDTIIAHLRANAFSVPPRMEQSTDPWCSVTSVDGYTTVIPKGYRLPLMFAMRFQWQSLRLVVLGTSKDCGNDEWDFYKFDILHVSRMCRVFLEQAREATAKNAMDRHWRCAAFDRLLTRYYRRWLVTTEEFVKDFFIDYDAEEYERDAVKNDWQRWVQKGHKGFRLTKEETLQGLSYEKETEGLFSNPAPTPAQELKQNPGVTTKETETGKEKEHNEGKDPAPNASPDLKPTLNRPSAASDIPPNFPAGSDARSGSVSGVVAQLQTPVAPPVIDSATSSASVSRPSTVATATAGAARPSHATDFAPLERRTKVIAQRSARSGGWGRGAYTSVVKKPAPRKKPEGKKTKSPQEGDLQENIMTQLQEAQEKALLVRRGLVGPAPSTGISNGNISGPGSSGPVLAPTPTPAPVETSSSSSIGSARPLSPTRPDAHVNEPFSPLSSAFVSPESSQPFTLASPSPSSSSNPPPFPSQATSHLNSTSKAINDKPKSTVVVSLSFPTAATASAPDVSTKSISYKSNTEMNSKTATIAAPSMATTSKSKSKSEAKRTVPSTATESTTASKKTTTTAASSTTSTSTTKANASTRIAAPLTATASTSKSTTEANTTKTIASPSKAPAPTSKSSTKANKTSTITAPTTAPTSASQSNIKAKKTTAMSVLRPTITISVSKQSAPTYRDTPSSPLTAQSGSDSGSDSDSGLGAAGADVAPRSRPRRPTAPPKLLITGSANRSEGGGKEKEGVAKEGKEGDEKEKEATASGSNSNSQPRPLPVPLAKPPLPPLRPHPASSNAKAMGTGAANKDNVNVNARGLTDTPRAPPPSVSITAPAPSTHSLSRPPPPPPSASSLTPTSTPTASTIVPPSSSALLPPLTASTVAPLPSAPPLPLRSAVINSTEETAAAAALAKFVRTWGTSPPATQMNGDQNKSSGEEHGSQSDGESDGESDGKSDEESGEGMADVGLESGLGLGKVEKPLRTVVIDLTLSGDASKSGGEQHKSEVVGNAGNEGVELGLGLGLEREVKQDIMDSAIRLGGEGDEVERVRERGNENAMEKGRQRQLSGDASTSWNLRVSRALERARATYAETTVTQPTSIPHYHGSANSNGDSSGVHFGPGSRNESASGSGSVLGKRKTPPSASMLANIPAVKPKTTHTSAAAHYVPHMDLPPKTTSSTKHMSRTPAPLVSRTGQTQIVKRELSLDRSMAVSADPPPSDHTPTAASHPRLSSGTTRLREPVNASATLATSPSMPSVTATATAMTSSHATGSISLKSQSPIRVDTRVPITEVLSNAPSLLHAQSLQHLLTESAIQPTSPVDTSASPTISVHARSEAAIPPLPGARIPGDLLENYSLITPAWESEPGSGTSSSSMTEFEMGNSYDSHPRQSDSARDFQQNRSLHHSDLCPSPHRNATNSSTPALSRHHPYPAHARQRYHASHLSATPHQDSPDRRHHPFLYYPSASAPRHPDVDPDDGADDFEVLEREPVVKKVVAMIRDTLVGLNEILDASGAESASAIRRRAKGKGRAYPAAHNASTSRYASTAGFGTLSAATTLRRDEATESGSSTGADTILAQLGGEGEILDEMRSLVRESMELKEEKVEQQEEMRRLRLEVEDLRKQVLLMGGQQKHTVPSTAFPKDEVPIHDLVSSASSPPYDPERGRSPSVHPSAHIDRTRRGPRESFVSSVSNPASSHPPAPEPKLVDDDGSIHSPPWTPDKEDPSHHVQIDSVPLPVKSQRKHRLMQVSKMENQD